MRVYVICRSRCSATVCNHSQLPAQNGPIFTVGKVYQFKGEGPEKECPLSQKDSEMESMYHTCHYTLTWRATFLCHCLDPWLSITLPPFFQPSCCLNTFLRCYGYSRVNMKAQCMVQPMYTHAIPTKTESFSLHNYVVSTQLLIYICEIDLFQLIL